MMLQNKVAEIVADLFGLPIEQVGPDASPSTIDAWDSFQQLNLVLALEQEFGIQFNPEEIEVMKSVDSIVQLLKGKS